MTKRTVAFGIAVSLWLELTLSLHSQAGVAITGRVYDADTNRPLPAVRISTAAPNALGSILARSNDDGTFTLDVQPGQHLICVDGGLVYLDPCQWARGTTTVDTAQSTVLNLPLQKGVLLTIGVYDPNSAVQAARNAHPAAASGPAPPLSVLIASGGGVRPVPFTGATGASSRFSVLVPPSTAFDLTVASSVLALADASGNALPQNAFRTSFVSPSPTSSPDLSPLGRVVGPNIPSRAIQFIITGLI